MDLAELIVDAARRACRWDRILADGGTVLTLEAGGNSTAYFVVRAGDSRTANVWYPYLRHPAAAAAPDPILARFRMRIDERNLPVVYLVATTMVSTFASELAETPAEVRVRVHMAKDPRTLLYDRAVRPADSAAAVATDPELVRSVREGFTVALHAALSE